MTILIIQSNPVSREREQEYNDWYDNVHVPEILTTPGVIAATRYRMAKAQLGPTAVEYPYRYIAVYELEGDTQESLAAIVSAMSDGRIGSSDLMSDDRANGAWDTVLARTES